jgi:thiamine biosynthesis lipoprotein
MIFFLTSIFALLLATGFSFRTAPTRYEFAQVHMGTRFEIILYAPNAYAANRASQAAFRRIAELDAIMSDYSQASELMQLCHNSNGQWVKVSEDLFRVLARSQEMAQRSEGAFDVTVGQLVRLWRRARRTAELPSPERIKQALELTGYRKLHLDEKSRSVRLERAGMLLDLGGIAKGYAADEAIKLLKSYGIDQALVAAGGDIVVTNPPPAAKGWTIGIASFDSPNKPPTIYLLLHDAAVSTSGDAEQHVEIQGVRYSHIVDPKSGQALTGHSSVTVVAADGTTSDSLATAVSVLGPERGLKLVDSMKAAALIIQATQQGQRTFKSKRWKFIPLAEEH